MGKKGKKKKGEGSAGGEGGKKKKGKKGKSSEPQMSWKEALYAYQINIKERQLEDVRYELRALEEKNERHKERNERLSQEQLFYMKHLLKQAKEFEKALSDESVIEKEEVVKVMKDKWQAARSEDRDIAALKEQIARKEAEITREKKEVAYWHQYKDRGCHSHGKQIKLLQDELVDMQKSFDEMAAHLERTLGHAKTEIEKQTEERLDQQKYLATEKAMAKMDKNSRQEVLDNDWLKREVEIHKRESDDLLAEVEEIERENLAIMEQLFECTVDDLKISRNFFLTQFQDNENLEETGILEMDLAKISLDPRLREIANRDVDEDAPSPRPISATGQYIEAKVHGMELVPLKPRPEEDEDEGGDTDESDYDGDNAGYNSEEEDPFNNYYNFEDEAFDDYLQLGPLELKLLSVRGVEIPIHKPVTPSVEEIEAKQYRNDDWPISRAALNKCTTPRS